MLFGSSSLELLIGVVLLFLVLAVIASAVAEIVAQVLALRSRTLHDAVSAMLFDKSARDKVFDHPLVKSLSHQGQIDKLFRRIARPSYIPSDVFARALLDNIAVTRGADGSLQVTALDGMAISADLEKLIKSLAAPLGPAIADAGKLAAEVETWFDDSMDRVAGWYKRKTQVVLIVIGAVVVIWANANVLRYASALAVNPSAREAVIAAAEGAVAAPLPSAAPSGSPAPGQPLTTAQALEDLKKLDFALGWDAAAAADDSRHLPATLEEIPRAIGSNLLGWLFAIAAVSMGAPFWFDLLSRAINLRGAGTKPPKANGP